MCASFLELAGNADRPVNARGLATQVVCLNLAGCLIWVGSWRAPLICEMTTHLQAGSEKWESFFWQLHGVVMAEVIELFVPQSYCVKVRNDSARPARVIAFPARKKKITWWSLGSRKLRSAVAIERLGSLLKARLRPAEYCPNSGIAQIRASSPDSTFDEISGQSANSKHLPFGI